MASYTPEVDESWDGDDVGSCAGTTATDNESNEHKIKKEYGRLEMVLGKNEATVLFNRIKACPGRYLTSEVAVRQKLAHLFMASRKETSVSVMMMGNVRQIREVDKVRTVAEINWLIERLQYIAETLHENEDAAFDYVAAARESGFYARPPALAGRFNHEPESCLVFYEHYRGALISGEIVSDFGIAQRSIVLSPFSYPVLEKYFSHFIEFLNEAVTGEHKSLIETVIGKQEAENCTQFVHINASPEAGVSKQLPWLLQSPSLLGGSGSMEDYELVRELQHLQEIHRFILLLNNSLFRYTIPKAIKSRVNQGTLKAIYQPFQFSAGSGFVSPSPLVFGSPSFGSPSPPDFCAIYGAAPPQPNTDETVKQLQIRGLDSFALPEHLKKFVF
mmetsp:Transcript_27205/g.60214  ORF Transcript_27205/g.60214 Transcript_27205/m.60214 type:complete len:389 (-) Transcript_27205:249-1415(-)